MTGIGIGTILVPWECETLVSLTECELRDFLCASLVTYVMSTAEKVKICTRVMSTTHTNRQPKPGRKGRGRKGEEGEGGRGRGSISCRVQCASAV